jgi:molybdopterin converting factor small subunit
VTITVLIPGALRADAGGASHLEFEAAADDGVRGTLGAVLDEMAERWPRLERRIRDERGELRRYVNVYVNGEDCRGLSGQQTPVPAGAEIQVLPSVAGG